MTPTRRRNSRRVQILAQKVYPKRSSFLGALKMYLGVGVGSCTLVQGLNFAPIFHSHGLQNYASVDFDA